MLQTGTEGSLAKFTYQRPVWFYETDAMGVVHHSNYIRYCEEARIDWIRHKGLMEEHYPLADITLAVTETRTQHRRPAYYNDILTIELQVKREKLKIYFRYAISLKQESKPSARVASPLLCVVDVVLVPIGQDFKVKRLSERFSKELEKEIWTETWPSNL